MDIDPCLPSNEEIIKTTKTNTTNNNNNNNNNNNEISNQKIKQQQTNQKQNKEYQIELDEPESDLHSRTSTNQPNRNRLLSPSSSTTSSSPLPLTSSVIPSIRSTRSITNKRSRPHSPSSYSLQSTHHSNSPSPQPNLQNHSNQQHIISSLDPTLEAINHLDRHSILTTDPDLINHLPNRSPKRKRHSENDPLDHIERSNTTNQPSLDTLQLAHLITSIQVQQHDSSAHAQPSSSSHVSGYPSLPPYLFQSGVSEHEWMDKIVHLLNPLKLEISRLRSRIETLEDERLVMAREITSLKGCFNNYPDLINPLSTPATRSTTTHQNLASNQDQSRIFPVGINSISNHSFDIPVGPLPDMPNQANSSNLNSVAHLLSAAQNSENKSAFPFRMPDPAPSSSSKVPSDPPFRRVSNARKKSEPSSSNFDSPTAGSNSNNRAKHRKPELSRTVRATVFRLMGVSSIHSPTSASANLPNDPACKFGSEKSRAYHGYTTSPCFPEYTSEELFDPITKAKLWRWDWSKTIRQSQNNTNFAKEIRNVIVKEAEDPVRPMHTDVPAIDWQYLNDAIDSAYTNMRRERDNLIDPNKMVKKEVHRARNKKRGLKEDKFKRRKKALDEYRADPHSFSHRLRDLNISMLPDKPSNRGTKTGNMNVQEGGAENSDQWEDAINIKYMSSEDEANVNDFENPIPVGIDQQTHQNNNNNRTDNTLASSDKVFAICRPTWRSQQLQSFFSFLDAVKQPERAYRRVMGPYRVATAPFGTPAWMVNDLANGDNDEGEKEGKSDKESGQSNQPEVNPS